jgi:hypothetical protein
MFQARVLGIPHVEEDEIVFAVWVQRPSSAAEIVRVTTPEPEMFFLEMKGHSTEVADLARDEVKSWIAQQQRFMDRLYARLIAEPKRRPIQSHVRDVAPSSGASGCALCGGTGESEKFLDRREGHARWAFGPKVRAAPVRERGSFVPCPACRRLDYDESVERAVSSDSLAAELERVEAIVTGRIATIRERIRSVAPRARLPAAPRARRT